MTVDRMTFPETALPIHPRTGLTAVGIVGGRPVWPILGGSGETDTAAAATTDAGTAATTATTATDATATQAATTAATTDATAAGATTVKPTPPVVKTFTQADVDSIIQRRMSSFEKTFGEKFAKALGAEPADTGTKLTPEAVLQQAQDIANGARQERNLTLAETLAEKAGIKPERLEVFLGLADLAGALKDVDANDAKAVKAAIKTAVDAKAAEYPEWKATAVAASSGADRDGVKVTGKSFTRAQLEGMSQKELAANADDILAAQAAGRIT